MRSRNELLSALMDATKGMNGEFVASHKSAAMAPV